MRGLPAACAWRLRSPSDPSPGSRIVIGSGSRSDLCALRQFHFRSAAARRPSPHPVGTTCRAPSAIPYCETSPPQIKGASEYEVSFDILERNNTKEPTFWEYTERDEYSVHLKYSSDYHNLCWPLRSDPRGIVMARTDKYSCYRTAVQM